MPIVAPLRPNSPFAQLIIELSRHLTPHRYRKHERWVAALPDFIDVHRSIAKDQYRYLDQPHRNYARPRGAWVSTLAPSQAYLLSAANVEARIAFAECALRQLRQQRELYRAPLHFVTVSPLRYVRPFETASQTDLRSLQKLTGQALSGLSFIGAPDFALFKAWGLKGIRNLHNHVGPHTHSVVFGASRDQIVQGLKRAGLGSGGWTGGHAYNIRKIEPDQLEGYLLYLLKAPLFFYHAKQGARLFRNRDSGEEEHHSQFKSHPLRAGDQLRMAAVVHEMYMDELLFGQGAGTALAREIRSDGRKPLQSRNKVAEREGRRTISSTVNIMPKSRPLLSACIREPIVSRMLRRWSCLYPQMEGMKSNGHRPCLPKPSHRKPGVPNPELDDLDGDL